MNLTPFSKASYLSQVRRLRSQAQDALKNYPIGSYHLDFIHHGENTTFKVTTRKHQYLLRLHRNGYHTDQAILEELNWLKALSLKSDIPVQKPVLTKSKKLFVLQNSKFAPTRYCDLLHWQKGHLRYQGLTQDSFFKVGRLLGKLHDFTRSMKVKHRNYWSIDGLIGDQAKFGSLKALKDELRQKQYSDLMKSRSKIKTRIKNYHRKNPHSMGLIHADLHFGNMLWHEGEIHPIDFDDCGRGYYLYDLAIVLIGSWGIFQKKGKKFTESAMQRYYEGYQTVRPLTQAEIETVPYFGAMRRLCMFGWLYERRDNPRLREHFKKSLPYFLKGFRYTLKKKPTFSPFQSS